MNRISLATVAAIAAMGAFSIGTASAQDGATAGDGTATAIFAGGCFWCVEADFDKVPGVTGTTSGYTGGTAENPTYEEVSRENTGHYEAVEISYDPSRVDYRTLVDVFFRHVDPTDAGGQFCDRGPSYRTAIFVDGPQQRAAAEAAKTEASELLQPEVVTPIVDASTFYPAEGYHQDYYEKNSLKYKYYRWRCGRDARIDEIWNGARSAS